MRKKLAYKCTKGKKKKGFTLIELLAVIIILGILVLLAVPRVAEYISESRKNSYVTTAKNLMDSARNLVNDGKLDMFDIGTTYYIPGSYIKTDSSYTSPYGDLTEAYIGVIYNGKGYEYYWICRDETGQGISTPTPYKEIEIDKIVSDISAGYVDNYIATTGIKGRKVIKLLNTSGEWETVTNDAPNNFGTDEEPIQIPPELLNPPSLSN